MHFASSWFSGSDGGGGGSSAAVELAPQRAAVAAAACRSSSVSIQLSGPDANSATGGKQHANSVRSQ